MRAVVLLLLSLLGGAGFAQKTYRCYKSVDPKIKFTFRMNEDDDHSNATLQYFGQKKTIPLKFVKEIELKKHKGHPSEMRIIFNEVVNGKITGQITFDSQGAVINNAYYTRQKDKRKIKLSDNVANCSDFE